MQSASNSELSDILANYGQADLRQAYQKPRAAGTSFSVQSSADNPLPNWYVAEYARAVDVEDLVARLQNDPAVEYAEPVYICRPEEIRPNDPFYAQQDYLRQINAPSGWELFTGSAAVKIAVIDSGVQLNHPDLQEKILPGWDCLDEDDDPSPDLAYSAYQHGTIVAGLAAAVGGNNRGIAGVDWRAKIIPLKVFGQNPRSGQYDVLANAIIRAADLGADVINMSLSGPSFSQYEKEAVAYAAARGVILVAAMGNSNDTAPLDAVRYPAAFAEVIAVGSVDSRNQLSGFSVRGRGAQTVELLAPGENIYSTYAGSSYASGGSGTSYAAPLVSGLAALLKGQNPQLKAGQIRQLLRDTSDDLGAAGYDPLYGFGLINVARALSGAPSSEFELLPASGQDQPSDLDRTSPVSPLQSARSGSGTGEKVYSYPNPLRPLQDATAHIAYTVEKSGWTTIYVYNPRGGRVWQASSYAEAQTENIVKWDGRDAYGRVLGNGSYIVMVLDDRRKILAKGRLLLLD
ncbi:putative peptidase [Candidatus Termititenax aidoneus]|uniref:Peptidase n=1 Tax=Termititenax aidoneus TaxID=2218524 RepID=A0A388TBV4_TERA1|nr:putative peptidase [Candidatus Termititenax aidoneus]